MMQQHKKPQVIFFLKKEQRLRELDINIIKLFQKQNIVN